MTQEVQVTMTIYLEADCSKTKRDVEDFIKEIYHGSGISPYNIKAVEIDSIKEEAEIYSTEEQSYLNHQK